MSDINKIVKAIQILVKEEVKKQLNLIVKEEVSKQVRKIIKENKSLVKESVNTINHNDFDEWPTMQNTLSMATPRVMMDMSDIVPVGVNIDPSNASQGSVLKAMNRDYSELMKAINKGK
jgi:uncharacterized linocin/CFP29 family protein